MLVSRSKRCMNSGGVQLRIQAFRDGVSIKGKDMLFINVGQEARGLSFLARRGSSAEMISFEVRPEFLAKMRNLSIPEAGSAGRGLPIRVDTTNAVDQFGVPSKFFEEMIKNVVPNTVKKTTLH